MRVLYDGNIYLMQAAGGVNRYFANLIAGLPIEVTPYMTTCETRNVNYPAHPNLKVYSYRRFRPAGVSYRLEKLFFDYVATARRYDLAHPSYYTLLTRRGVDEYRCPVVITVWDMIPELFRAELDPYGWNAEAKRKAIMAAQAVICISQNTKRDLLERYAIPEERVSVTHLASEIDAGISHGPEPVPAKPFFLYVGLRHGYKNFGGLLTAFAKARSLRAGAALCVVGAPFSNDEEKQIASLGLTDSVENFGHVTDAHLAKLYRCSVAFVYPSLYEGFGIPPLEAMACGTPVIASNRSSVPEVVGDAGLLFDPDSTDDLADLLIMLADDPSQRERLIAKGRQHVKGFSWEKTVAQTLEVYRSVSAGARAETKMNNPKITVVTPSFNQGQFLEETILSVVGQQYPNLEYIVIDGGSTDTSVEILKKHEHQLTFWVSEQDRGQAHAINKGFARATGDILCWLNSDDLYVPGALSFIASRLDSSRAELLFGNCFHFFEGGATSHGSDVVSEHKRRDLLLSDYIIQPSSFWTRQAWVQTGELDESLTFGFDWEWFIRARKGGTAFTPVDKYLSAYRFHSEHKSSTGGERRLNELAAIYNRHAGTEYGRLFARCLQYRSGISFGRRWLSRLKLSRFDGPLFKLAFPTVFRGFRKSDISDMITML